MATFTVTTTITRPRMRYGLNSQAALRANSGRDGDVVVLHGHTTEGDGGGGVFYWDEDRAGEDDFGTVIRGWVRDYEGALDAAWFGCLPGLGALLPRSTQLQYALDAAETAGRGHLRLPDGVFYVDDTTIVPSNVRVTGGGMGVTVIRGKTAGTYAGPNAVEVAWYATLACVAADSVTIENLTIDHSTPGTVGCNGIALVPNTPGGSAGGGTGTYCTNITVRNCEILQNNSHEYGIWNLRGQRINILDCLIDGGVTSYDDTSQQEGIESFGGYKVRIQGCRVRRCGNAGIYLATAPGVANADFRGVQVLGNEVEGCAHNYRFVTSYDATVGIGAQNMQDVLIAGNVSRSAWLYGYRLVCPYTGTSLTNVRIVDNIDSDSPEPLTVYGHSASATTCHGVSISGNTLSGATGTAIGSLNVYFIDNVKVTGNSVYDGDGSGIWVQGCALPEVHGNTVDTVAKYGITVPSCSGVDVKNNSIMRWGSAGSFAGLYVTTATGGVIAGNRMTQTNANYDLIISGDQVWEYDNVVLHDPDAALFANAATNTNYGVTAAMTALATTIDVANTLVSNRTKFAVHQVAGAPLAFKVAKQGAGLRITTASAAVGDETFAWRLFA